MHKMLWSWDQCCNEWKRIYGIFPNGTEKKMYKAVQEHIVLRNPKSLVISGSSTTD